MTLITENAKNIAKEKLAELIQRYATHSCP